jgi:hypothetical protein
MMNRLEQELLKALKAAVDIAREAVGELEAEPSGIKAKKLLLALAGFTPHDRPEIAKIHAAIAKAEAPPLSWSFEEPKSRRG